jgi:hypothetical protein
MNPMVPTPNDLDGFFGQKCAFERVPKTNPQDPDFKGKIAGRHMSGFIADDGKGEAIVVFTDGEAPSKHKEFWKATGKIEVLDGQFGMQVSRRQDYDPRMSQYSSAPDLFDCKIQQIGHPKPVVPASKEPPRQDMQGFMAPPDDGWSSMREVKTPNLAERFMSLFKSASSDKGASPKP